MLNLRPSTSSERKLLLEETFINSTDQISKVSPNSVFSGASAGIAKVIGKAEKDIILALSQLFPDDSYGQYLDQVALNLGIASRLSAQGSSTYVRVVGTPGTNYTAGTNQCQSTDGIIFDFESNFTIPTFGYTYQKVDSDSTGLSSNVSPLTITVMSPAPSGHIGVINEYSATGGLDQETDDLFRARIKQGSNVLARGTLSMLEQVFISINPKVLKIFHHGIDNNGKVIISIVTQNGVALTTGELNTLLSSSSDYFGLTEYKPYGTTSYGIILQNIVFQPIDVSFRVQLDSTVNPDQVRINIQTAFSKYLDFRNFVSYKDVVEWDNLLEIVKSTEGVTYVPDQYFYPRVDVAVDDFQLPRIRGFLMLNLDGTIISNFSGTLNPVYYPNVADFAYQSSVLRDI
jgi:hypothetical protein